MLLTQKSLERLTDLYKIDDPHGRLVRLSKFTEGRWRSKISFQINFIDDEKLLASDHLFSCKALIQG